MYANEHKQPQHFNTHTEHDGAIGDLTTLRRRNVSPLYSKTILVLTLCDHVFPNAATTISSIPFAFDIYMRVLRRAQIHTHRQITNTHTHTYIYIYIYEERFLYYTIKASRSCNMVCHQHLQNSLFLLKVNMNTSVR